MKYETLLTELADGVMTVTLNRPGKLNAFNTAMSSELIYFFQRVNAMDEVRLPGSSPPARARRLPPRSIAA
jgi:enoyl-CoA hydratase/carnithine racemase